MVRKCELTERWPRLMPATVAAAYVGEASTNAFRRGVGKIWPRPKKIRHKGERWLREELDEAIDRLMMNTVEDAADVL
jgi:hypothetical protein